LQAIGLGLDVAVLLSNLGTHLLEPFDMQVDRTSSDRAASREGNPRNSQSRHQRPKHERGSTHCLYQFVLCFRAAQIPTADAGAMVCPAHPELNLCSHRLEQLAFGLNVANIGD